MRTVTIHIHEIVVGCNTACVGLPPVDGTGDLGALDAHCIVAPRRDEGRAAGTADLCAVPLRPAGRAGAPGTLTDDLGRGGDIPENGTHSPPAVAAALVSAVLRLEIRIGLDTVIQGTCRPSPVRADGRKSMFRTAIDKYIGTKGWPVGHETVPVVFAVTILHKATGT